MNKKLAFIVALLVAAPCFGQESVGIIIGPADTHGNLREIAGLADPNASRVLKWNDTTNVIEWGTDSTGGGGSGDTDGFAADPSSNTNFAPSIWRSDLGLALDADVQRYDIDLQSIAGGIVGMVKGLDDDGGFTAASLGTDYINNSSIDTSAELAAIVGNETGTGALVFGTSPTLTTPSFSSIVNTGTLTLPTSTDTLVGRTTTDTLTNKTLTAPTLNGTPVLGSASAWRTALSLVPGTSVQGYDIDLTSIAGGVVGLVKGLDDGGGFTAAVAGTDYVAPDADLTDLADGTLTGSKVSGAVTVSGGTINNSVIGGTTPAAATFTNATVNGTLKLYDSVAAAYVDVTVEDSTVTYENLSGVLPMIVADEAYDATGWNGDLSVPTKNAVRDKIESLTGLTTASIDTSAELAAIVTDETGSGALVFGTSPTLTTPTLNGTPTLGSASSWRTALALVPGTNVQEPAPITIYKTDGTQVTRGVGLSGDALGDALESAITNDLLTGYRMKLGPGNFTGISDDLLLPSNVTIEGSGPTTLLKLEGSRTDAVVAIFSNADTSSGNSDIRIANMTLDMNNTQNTDTTKKQSGVMFTKVDRFIVEGLVCQNAGRLLTDTCVGIHLIGCTDGQVINNKCTNVVDGINTQASTDFCCRLYIGGNVIESTNRDYGLTMFQIYDSVIANNVISGAFKQGIEISYSSNNVFANNFVKNCGKQTTVTYPGINISSVGAPANNLLIGNMVRNGTSGNLQNYGIVVNSSSSNNVLIGNDFTDGGDTGAMNILSSSCVQLGNVTGNATLDASASRTALGATAGVWAGSLVAAATTSAQGASELATSAETTTGSDTTRTITPDGLRGSDYGKRIGQFICVGSATALTTGDGKGEVFYRVPSELNGWDLVGVAAAVDTVSSSGTPTFQVRRRRLTSATATSDADMLSTAITIDASEFDSKDATTAAVINTSNDDLQTGDRIFADCDTAGTGTKGMSITLVFKKP